MEHPDHSRILLLLEALFFCSGVYRCLGIFRESYTYACGSYLCTLSTVLPLICNTLYTMNIDNVYSPITDGNNVKIFHCALGNTEHTC